MKRVIGILAVSALSLVAFAQGSKNPAPKISVKLSRAVVKQGDPIKATVTVDFAEGYHGYQNPPSDEFQKPVTIVVQGKDFKVGKITYPAGTDYKMEGETKPYKVYKGSVTIIVDLVAPKKSGQYDLKLNLEYQQCTDRDCWPPSTVTASAKVKVA